MRIRSWLLLGIGYVAGTRAGRERFEDLRDSVQGLAQSDLVADTLGRVRESVGLQPSANGNGAIRLPDEDDDIHDAEADEHEDAAAE